jgi:hypothetical protein
MPKRTARARLSVLPRTDPVRLAPWLLLALALPRIVRLLYPAVWVEDDLLLESSFAAARGLRPYVDFAHAQMPLLEWVGSLYIRLVGASHLRMEILNGAAIYATSVLLFSVARRAAGARAATAASLLYACHSLVFRYHVWAREFFVSALVLGAVLVVLDGRIAARRQVLAAASLLCAACAIKLTAVVAVAAIVGYVAAGMRAPRLAAALGVTVAAAFAAFVAFCVWRYGQAFIFQAFLFHFLKGRGGADAGPFYIASLLDVLGPLALFGVLRFADRRRWNTALGLAMAVLAADLLFIAVLSPTAWGHNYLEAWPLVALLAGAGLDWLIDACRSARLAAAGAVAVTAVFLTSVTPLDNEASLRGSVYGFGFVSRAELAQLAGALAAGSDPHAEVVAPSFIAFEANRLQAIRYPENIGVMTVGREQWRTEGFRVARETFGSRSFFDLIDETSHIWNDQFARAIAPGGPVNAVIPDAPVQLLPLVNASPDALAARGFHLSERTEHFSLWLRPPGHVESRAETIQIGTRHTDL